MNLTKASFLGSSNVWVASLLWAIAIGLPAIAQTLPTETNRGAPSRSPIIFSAPDLTDKGRPGDRQGAASRGPCSRNVNARELLALVPDTETNPSVGLTVDEHPTFWFSIPYAAQTFYAIEFELLEPVDGQETLPPSQRDYNTLYASQLTNTTSLPGIASFRLPETAPPLKPNKTYKWFVRFYCEEPRLDYPEMPLFMGGSIIRVEPAQYSAGEPEPLDLAIALASSPRERALILARYGIWYDAFNEIATLHRTGAAIADLQALLEAISSSPIAS
ncbi:MAG: DUF928 domain-containing protein, partial [Cyanobacteriota bacterium]|nr:DUF928 domain-containing protein [Cyanobacteriota bacterium]